MRPTTKNTDVQLSEKLTLTTEELMQVLSCGRASAIKVGTMAGAKCSVGRRTLWATDKVRTYVRNLAR